MLPATVGGALVPAERGGVYVARSVCAAEAAALVPAERGGVYVARSVCAEEAAAH